VVLLLHLSLAMDNSEFNNVGGGGSGGGPAAAAVVAAVVVVDDRDGVQWRQWQGRLMAVAAFEGIQRQR
jgi:hypothetical protein